MKIHWLLILLTGALLEILLLLIFEVLYLIGVTVHPLVSPFLVPALMVGGGFFVANKAGNRKILHGFLTGLAGILGYFLIAGPAFLAGEIPVTERFLFLHGLKIAGGLIGGIVAWYCTRGQQQEGSSETEVMIND